MGWSSGKLFTSLDSYQGNNRSPITLNKYLYAHSDPANGIDPSGHMTLGEVGASLNMASNLYTAASLSYNILAGNYGVAGVQAKEIAEEVVLSKLSYLKPVAKLSYEAYAMFGRLWSRTLTLKHGYGRSSTVLRHNMEQILGSAPAGHQAHHIVGGAYPEGKQATAILEAKGIDVNSVMNGVFLPGCGTTGAVGSIHCGKHNQAYERLVLRELKDIADDKIALVNKLNEIREMLLSGSLRLNKH